MSDPSPAHGWRPMAPADLPAIVAISAAVHGEYAEDLATYTERLGLYPAGCLTYVQDGAVAGFLVSHPWHGATPPKLNAPLGAIPVDADSYYLHDIALLPETRGSGAGRSATDFVLGHARERALDNVTLVAVNGADSFWAARGFAIDAAAPSPYGEGSFVMRRRS